MLRARTFGFETRRIRVASAGVRRMSAKNLGVSCCSEWLSSIHSHSLGNGGTTEVDGRAVLDGLLARAAEIDELLLLRLSVRNVLSHSRPPHIPQTSHHPCAVSYSSTGQLQSSLRTAASNLQSQHLAADPSIHPVFPVLPPVLQSCLQSCLHPSIHTNIHPPVTHQQQSGRNQ